MERKEIKFGRNLLTLRNQNKITQQELADKLHVTRQTVSLWERGQGKPDIYYLNDVCQLFGISTEKMLYGTVMDKNDDILPEQVSEEIYRNGKQEGYIKNLHQKGFYTILIDEIYDFFGIIRLALEEIIVIALSLHQRGYIVTEIFENGFSVVFLTDDEAERFSDILYDIIDSFIHCDDEYVQEKRESYSEILNAARHDSIMKAMAEIYGKSPEGYKYYWIDMEENPRGYADSEQECIEQAKKQECNDFRILQYF